ncbi:MAG: AhpC/TSA family protein [Bacteroidales bacterium]|nr:AhpC/TSA family protein [Bacteroidales bacterium]
MIKQTLILLSVILALTGCNRKDMFTINGTIKEKSKKVIYLNKLNINTLVLIDSSKISRSGRFHFRVRSKDPDFYQIGYSDNAFVTVLAEPGEKIRIDFSGKSLLDGYSVTGSEGSEQVQMLEKRLAETKARLDSLRNEYEEASGKPGFKEKESDLNTRYIELVKDLRRKNIEFIIENLRSMASIMALYQKIDDDTYVLYDQRDLQYMKLVSDSLSSAYPNSANVKALTEDFKNELNRMYARQIQNIANTRSEVKLDPNLEDINGRRIALSSLKGKIVLLTFWSAQSKECIADNLQLKQLYARYRNRGFEIYQVNLDENREMWKNGVRFDDLPWISTREDDPGNPVNARLFNVQTLPANYLFDRSGEIAGSNLFGRQLQIKLDQLLNN